MKIQKILLIAILGFYCSIAFSGNENIELTLTPNYNFDERNITILGIVLDKNYSLNDVMQKLGSAKVISDISNKEEKKVCYKSSTDNTGLVFLSQWDQVTDVWIYRDVSKLKFYKECKFSVKVNKSISTLSGISLNLSSDAINGLGVEMHKTSNVISYQNHFRVKKPSANDTTYGSRYIVISIKFEFTLDGDDIDSLWISKTSEEW
jgi:hypothetical protein